METALAKFQTQATRLLWPWNFGKIHLCAVFCSQMEGKKYCHPCAKVISGLILFNLCLYFRLKLLSGLAMVKPRFGDISRLIKPLTGTRRAMPRFEGRGVSDEK